MSGSVSAGNPRPRPTSKPTSGVDWPGFKEGGFVETWWPALAMIVLAVAVLGGGALWDHFHPSPPWEQTYTESCQRRCSRAGLRFVSVDLGAQGACVCGAP